MINIQAILRDYSIPSNPNVNPGWINVHCPFCRDSGFHGGFNLAGGYFNCWKCGGHSIKNAIQALLHLDYKAYRAFIDPYCTDMLMRERLNKKVPKAQKIELPKKELSKLERKYLIGRNFEPDYLVDTYKLRSGGEAGKFKYRIVIPILLHNKVVSLTSRTIIEGKKPRYWTLPVEESVVNPKSIFYNLDNSKGRKVCVVEGPADVWRMGSGFICSLGTELVQAQILLLGTYFDEVMFLYDPEIEAQKKALKHAEQVSALAGIDVIVVDTELDEDPGGLSDKMARRLRKKLGFDNE